jgi:hypothetical protein
MHKFSAFIFSLFLSLASLHAEIVTNKDLLAACEDEVRPMRLNFIATWWTPRIPIWTSVFLMKFRTNKL